ELRDQFFAMEQRADFVALTFNGQFMPNAAGNAHLRPDRFAPLSPNDFVKAKRISQRTGAHDIVIGFVLNSKRNAGHFLFDAVNSFETRRESKIAKDFLIENQQRKMLVGGVL